MNSNTSARAGVLLALLVTLSTAITPALAQDGSRPIYVSLLPHFVVNLGSADFMQIKAQVLVENTDTEQAMKLHMPAIRHALLMLFTDLDRSQVASAGGKEQLNADALAVIRNTLSEHGAPDAVNGFFITDIVIQ